MRIVDDDMQFVGELGGVKFYTTKDVPQDAIRFARGDLSTTLLWIFLG